MNPDRLSPRRPAGIHAQGPATAGFTMVELALCIAVVAVAIVAIVGVLPAGINVQKNNREDTIVTADAAYLMEILRNGSLGEGELTNYVDLIRVAELERGGGGQTNYFLGRNYARSGLNLNLPARNRFSGLEGLVSATNIVGLLSIPSYELRPARNGTIGLSNEVVAIVRAINGSAVEKPARPRLPLSAATDSTNKFDLAFRYLLRTRITPFVAYSTANGVDPGHLYLRDNLYDVQLSFEWPVFVAGGQLRTGGNRRTFRTQVSGRLDVLRSNLPPDWTVVARVLRRDEHFASDFR